MLTSLMTPSSTTMSTSLRGCPGSSRVAPRITRLVMSPIAGHVDGVDAVDLLQQHPHPVRQLGRDVLADVVGTDWQLAMAAIHHHRQLHTRGAAQLGEGVEGGACGAAVVDDAVDEHHQPAIDGGGAGAGGYAGGVVRVAVVAVVLDIQL